MRLTTPDYSDTAGRTGLWRCPRRAGGRLRSFLTVSIAALIGLAPVAAFADTITQNFTIMIGGSDTESRTSSSFADFYRGNEQ